MLLRAVAAASLRLSRNFEPTLEFRVSYGVPPRSHSGERRAARYDRGENPTHVPLLMALKARARQMSISRGPPATPQAISTTSWLHSSMVDGVIRQ